MAPYQNTRSGLRASQKVENKQPIQNTRSGSSSSQRVEDVQSSRNTPIPQVEDKQPCFLLDAHPETRNEIYRLVLVSEIEVAAADSLPMDPPLLRTNRQIRSEARGIFYQENRVKISVLNYNISKINAWLGLSSAHRDMYANAQLVLSVTNQNTICWYNLRYWVYQYNRGRCPRLTLASSSLATDHIHATDRDRRPAIGLFDVADAHLASGSDFHTTHVALEQYRTSSMSPNVDTHRIWWNSSDLPPPPPPTAYSFTITFNHGPPMGPLPMQPPQHHPMGFPSTPPLQYHPSHRPPPMYPPPPVPGPPGPPSNFGP